MQPGQAASEPVSFLESMPSISRNWVRYIPERPEGPRPRPSDLSRCSNVYVQKIYKKNLGFVFFNCCNLISLSSSFAGGQIWRCYANLKNVRFTPKSGHVQCN